MHRRRLFVLIAATSSLLTCQQHQQLITDQRTPPLEENPPAHSLSPVAVDSAAYRTITETQRLNYSMARLAVEKVHSHPSASPSLRIDKSVTGEAGWLRRSLEQAGASISDQSGMWILHGVGPGGLTAALRGSLALIHPAAERCRSNLLSADDPGHRSIFGQFEQAVLGITGEAPDQPTWIDFTPGRLTPSKDPLDVAITGTGLFTIEIREDDRLRRLYTRDGRFIVRPDGAIAARAIPESMVIPYLAVPEGAHDVGFSADGTLHYQLAGETTVRSGGRLGLSWFEYPERLTPVEHNFFARSAEAGAIQQGTPGELPFGRLAVASVERSNLNPIKGWLCLSRLEDARNLVVAMLEELNSAPVNGAATITSLQYRVRPAVVTIPHPRPRPDEVEPALLRFLRLRGIDALLSSDFIELPISPENAVALLDYLQFTRSALRTSEDNIANASAGRSDQPRSTVRLTGDGAFEVVANSRPIVLLPDPSAWLAETEIEKLKAESLAVEFRAVIDALQDMGSAAVPAIGETLKSGPCELRADAARMLGRIGGDAAAAVPLLMEALACDDWEVSREAATALQRISTNSNTVDRALVRFWITQLQARDLRRSHFAAWALGSMGSRASSAVPALARALDNPAIGAAHALGELGPLAAPALDSLMKSLAHPDGVVREQVADALGRIGPKARTAVAALVHAAGTDPISAVRWRAAAAVARIGAKDSGCIASLAALLNEQPPDIRDRVLAALDEFDTTRNELNRHMASLGPPISRGRELALVSLAVPPVDALSGVTALVALLLQDDAAVRVLACQALGQVGLLAAPAAPILAQMTEDTEDRVAVAAIEALGRIRVSSPEVITSLALSLLHANPVIRQRAADALAKQGPPAESAIPSLIDRLGDASDSVVVSCIEALKQVGARTQETRDALKMLDSHRSAGVRLAAANALQSLSESGMALHASKGDEESASPDSR